MADTSESRDSRLRPGGLQTIAELTETPFERFNAGVEIELPVQESIQAHEKFEKGAEIRLFLYILP